MLVLTALWVLLFLRLKTDWEVNPQYSYGWLVPVLGAVLLWTWWIDRPAAGVSNGIVAVVIVVVLALTLGPIRLIEEANPEWRMVLWAHAMSVLLISFAYVYFAGGWRWVKHFALPFCFLLICVPWPTAIELKTAPAVSRFGLVAVIVLFIVVWLIPRGSRALRSSSEKADVQATALAPRPWPRALTIGLLLVIIASEAGTRAWYRAHEVEVIERPRWTVNWPTNATAYREVRITRAAQALLRCDESRGAAWRDAHGNQWLVFFLRWESGRSSAQLAKSHTPDVCLAATGAELIEELETHTVSVRGLELPFEQYAFEQDRQPLHVFHCIWEDRVSKTPVDLREDWSVASRIQAARFGKRHLGQRALEIAVSGPTTPAEAQSALERELETLLSR